MYEKHTRPSKWTLNIDLILSISFYEQVSYLVKCMISESVPGRVVHEGLHEVLLRRPRRVPGGSLRLILRQLKT